MFLSRLRFYWLTAVITGLLVILTLLFLAWLLFKESSAKLVTLQIGQAQIKVEIASTPDQLRQGLSGRERLLPNHGMLFVFPQSLQRHFWMYDMKFPLDFIWINNNKIVQLNLNIQPPQAGEQPQLIMAKQSINMVLEAPAGWVEKNNVKLGDQVKLLITYP